MALAGAGGLALGAFNGIATAILRIPSLLTTLFSAATVTYLLPYATTLRDPRVAATAFDDWCNSANMPPMMLRMFLVIGLYAATLLAMLFADSRYSSGRLRRRTELFGALCVSGALSGLGGGIWLIDQSMTPLPFRMVGDLRVVAAAVLAGAAFFGGRGRGMLAGVCLPVALLTATVWRQIVAVLPWYGYDMQLALLMAMAILTQRGLSDAVSATRGRKAHFVAASALMWGGLLTLALSAAAPPASLKTFHAAGLCIFLAGAVLLLIARGLHSHDKALAR
jgi:ribose/xylose/arabinose/galactoside ABC-type transport system permease subunit